VDTKKYDVCVIGLGYVGLTLAAALADLGLSVIGIEKRHELVKLTNEGIPHFAEKGLSATLSRVVKMKKLEAKSQITEEFCADTYIITVGTPLGENREPRLDMIKQSAQEVASVLQEGNLVILRSTVALKTTNQIVKPILDKSNKTYFLTMCPERTLEGKAMSELRHLPQIIGSHCEEARVKAKALFSKLTPTTIEVASAETAELIKLVDNTYRDLNFAFANEIARLCEVTDINVIEVVKSGGLAYPRTSVPVPGPVGGPCLEKDPHILNWSANKFGLELELTNTARMVNERQPEEIVARCFSEALRRFDSATNLKICLLGAAFKGKPETNDLRGSMTKPILKQLNNQINNPKIELFDPIVTRQELEREFPDCNIHTDLYTAVAGSHIVIVCNNHQIFADIDPETLAATMHRNGFIYDLWNHFSDHESINNSEYYIGLGNV